MDFSCLTISNIFIYLFTQNPNTLTGFRIPRIFQALNLNKNQKNTQEIKVSGTVIPNFLKLIEFTNKKTKLRIVLIPKNDQSGMECPIEIARLTLNSCQLSSESLIIDDFNNVEMFDEENNSEDNISVINRVLKSIVNASILSPFVGILMSCSGKKEKLVQKNFKIEFRIEQNQINKKKQQKMSSGSKKDEIIIINPDSEKFENEVKESYLDFSKKNEKTNLFKEKNHSQSNNDNCSVKSQNSSDSQSESNKIFFGKTYSMNWNINLDNHLTIINLQIHDNLNSICSYISKVNFDQKSEISRKRFFSEERNTGLKKRKLTTPKHKRDFSIHSKYPIPVLSNQLIPFTTIKDDLIKFHLNKTFYNKSKIEKTFKMVMKESKQNELNISNEVTFDLIPKKEVPNKIKEEYKYKQKHGLKGLFKMTQFLKESIKSEISVKKKEKKISKNYSQTKISNYSSSNHLYQNENFNFMKNKKYSSKEESLSNNYQTQTTNDLNKTIEEDVEENSSQEEITMSKKSFFKILIKFGKI